MWVKRFPEREKANKNVTFIFNICPMSNGQISIYGTEIGNALGLEDNRLLRMNLG